MQMEKSTSISLDEYINRQIAGYIEIINKAQGAIEALKQMKESVVNPNEQETKGKTNEKKDTGAGRSHRTIPADSGANGAGTAAGK